MCVAAFEIRAMGEVKSRVSISAREQFLLESAAKNKGDPHGVLAPVVRGMRGELEGVISGVLTGVTYAEHMVSLETVSAVGERRFDRKRRKFRRQLGNFEDLVWGLK